MNLFPSIESQDIVVYEELDNAVRHVKDFFFEVYAGELSPFFRNGLPYKFADGKFGYGYFGGGYMQSDPVPKANDYRLAMRFQNPQEYRCEFKNFYKFEIPLTMYVGKLKDAEMNPNSYMQKLLISTGKAYPNYLRYLNFEMMKGDNVEMDPILKQWVEATIKQKKGENYTFLQGGGFGAINLSDVQTPKVAKSLDDQHVFAQIKKVNEAIKNEQRKITVNITEDKPLSLTEKKAGYKSSLDKGWPKKNITGPYAERAKKYYALCLAVSEAVRYIKRNSVFLSQEFKINKSTFEGALVPCSLDDVTLWICAEDADLWEMSTVMSELATKIEDPMKWLAGIRVIKSTALAPNTAYLIQNDAFQAWFPSEYIKTGSSEFVREETVDYWTKFAHTLNIVDLFGCAYFKVE